MKNLTLEDIGAFIGVSLDAALGNVLEVGRGLSVSPDGNFLEWLMGLQEERIEESLLNEPVWRGKSGFEFKLKDCIKLRNVGGHDFVKLNEVMKG